MNALQIAKTCHKRASFAPVFRAEGRPAVRPLFHLSELVDYEDSDALHKVSGVFQNTNLLQQLKQSGCGSGEPDSFQQVS